ncbi:MAG: nucleotidyltransferase domain-containing protein [Actinomycetota bacterium]
MSDILRRRRHERDQLIEQARVFARELDRRIGLEVAIVTGSVARGDFNVWSDVDLLIVSTNLEERAPDRNL